MKQLASVIKVTVVLLLVLGAMQLTVANAQDDNPPPPPSNDSGNPPPPPNNNGNPPSSGSGRQYTIEQAISDRAQQTTIAFSAMSFLTGNLCADSFLPPGKVSDLFGFQYLRDVDSDEMGHNTSFLTRIADNVLYILTDEQVAELITLAEEQTPLINEFAYMRFALMDAFRRQLAGDFPAGSEGLDREAVMAYSAELYRLDGIISFQRAEVLGRIVQSMDQTQRDYMDTLAAGGSLSWPEVGEQLDRRSFSHDVHVAVMTYSSQLFSWYAGSVESDAYFCPERHGTYFGSFYVKDAPAMGNAGYTISTSLTANGGDDFLALLTDSQRESITSLVDIQRDGLNEIVETRRAIATELRRLMVEDAANEATVLVLSERYGELDGELSYYYTTHFAEVYETLSAEQMEAITALRNLDEFPCDGAYLYSENINMPEIADTDFLFME